MSNEFASPDKVPILQGTANYTDWAMEIESTAQLGKYWRAITGDNDPVDSSAVSKENAANREEAALGLIKKTVIKTIALELRCIPDPNDGSKTITGGTANQLWKYLETRYSEKEGITSFHEFGALFRSNLVDDGTLEQQIDKLSDMRYVCAMNDFTLKDWQFSILVLHSLPPSYRHMPEKILVPGKIKDLKFSDVRARILEVESLRNGGVKAAENIPASVRPNRRGGRKVEKPGSPPSPCRFCQGNHWNALCKDKPKSSAQPDPVKDLLHQRAKPHHS